MAIRAIFFDVDGTLVSFGTHHVPASAAEALSKLREKGILIFVASGRMQPQMAILGGIPFDGYITNNGAGCFDGEWNLINCTPLPQDDIRRALHYIEHNDLTLLFTYGDSAGINRLDDRVVTAAKQCGELPPPVLDPYEALHRPVYQANIYVDEEQEEHLMREVFSGCTASRWHPLFADLNAKGVNKQVGMDYLLAHFGISREETMAFGDGGNDLPMLRHAGIGVAMGNANEEVKNAADYVTSTVDDGGVVAALKHFGLI